jgi:hypothetical protein
VYGRPTSRLFQPFDEKRNKTEGDGCSLWGPLLVLSDPELFILAKQAQRFLSAFGPISQYFQPRRHRLNAEEYRAIVQGRFQQWNEITGVELAS